MAKIQFIIQNDCCPLKLFHAARHRSITLSSLRRRVKATTPTLRGNNPCARTTAAYACFRMTLSPVAKAVSAWTERR